MISMFSMEEEEAGLRRGRSFSVMWPESLCSLQRECLLSGLMINQNDWSFKSSAESVIGSGNGISVKLRQSFKGLIAKCWQHSQQLRQHVFL